MPIYEYNCSVCGAIVEKIYKIEDKPEVVGCDNCKEEGRDYFMFPIMSSGSFVINGYNELNGYSGGN